MSQSEKTTPIITAQAVIKTKLLDLPIVNPDKS